MAIPKTTQLTQLLLVGFLLMGTIGCSQEAVGEGEEVVVKEATKFECLQQNGEWVTVATRGNIISQTPLFRWNTTEFGDEWTPKERCDHVSDKITQAVANNGGRLYNLTITTGIRPDNGYTIACFITSEQQVCNSGNQLFTLSQKNAQNPSAVLAKIMSFGEGKTENSTIDENGAFPQYVSFESAVEQSLGW